MTKENEQKVYDILDSLKIKYSKYEHKAIYTIEEANQLDIHIPGKHCKNLFLRNRKGDVHYLVIIHEAKQLNLKSLSIQIGSTSLSFASEERLNKYLGLKPGSVTPFGLINDTQKEVVVLIDKELTGKENISFHPNINTSTISISFADFERFLQFQRNKICYINI